jgi:FMN-dependent NADH-azoreductase
VKLLEIQSSPRGDSSDSITLTTSFVEACKSDNNSIVVDTLNAWHERLPEFDYEAIGAKYKAVKNETMTEAESNVWQRIQLLIQRFQNADRIVLGTPMWNFGLPYKLKQSSFIHAVHVSCRVLLYRPRNSIINHRIWTFGCALWVFEIFGA